MANNQKTPPQAAEVSPEYLRVPQALKLSGLNRSKLYEAISDGRIRSFSVRDPGKTRGIRLVSAESLRAFVESHAVTA